MFTLYLSMIDDEPTRRLFEEIYYAYRKQMFLVARKVLGDDHAAEDAVHDAFTRIAQSHMHTVSEISESGDSNFLRNYLLKAAKNCAINLAKRRHLERSLIDSEAELILSSAASPKDALLEDLCNKMEYDRVLRAISSLEDNYRDILYLRLVSGLTSKQIANLTGQKSSSVRAALSRGKKHLLAALSELENEYDKQ